MESSLKEETPNVELPNDENKLFDVDDDVQISTIPDLSLPSEEQEVKPNSVWEYDIYVLFKLSPLHPEGKCLRKWVKHQDMENMEQFSNGMKIGKQLENPIHPILRIHGIKVSHNS